MYNEYPIYSDTQLSHSTSFTPVVIVILLAAVILAAAVILFTIILKKLNDRSLLSKFTDAETGMGNLVSFEHNYKNVIAPQLRSLYYIVYIIVDSNYLQLYHNEYALTHAVSYAAKMLPEHTKKDEFAARITESGFAVAFTAMNADNAKKRAIELLGELNKYTGSANPQKPVFHGAMYNLSKSDNSCELILFNLRRNCSKMLETENQLSLCDRHTLNHAMEEIEIAESITRGFDNHEFKLYLQFVVNNKTKSIVSAEALSRWDNAEMGILSPGKYIDIMSSTGLITRLDYYMFDLVCAQLQKWSQKEGFKELSLSCNFTRITLSDDSFLEKIKQIYQKYSFDKSKLVIEITEEAMEKNLNAATNNVRKCKELGFVIALDDLGSGYTSLANLCDYPIDIVKIDRDILLKTESHNGKALFEGIIALAHSLKLKVVCEGVETDQQNELVHNSACDYVQGWYYSRVLPIDECEEFFEKYQIKKLDK